MRYKEYTKVDLPWVEEVPSHWKIKNVNNLFDERREKVSDKDYPPLSVTKNGILPQLENVAKSMASDNRKKVLEGDFVINSRSDRKGSSGLSSYDGSVSLISTVIKPRLGFSKFWNYLLKSNDFIEEFYRNGKGIVADLWTTNFQSMKSINLPFPPKEEQEQIARFLDWKINQIDRLILKKKEKLKSVDNYVKINIFKMLDRLNNEEIPLKRILAEKMTDGPHETPAFVSDGIPFVSVEAVENGRINLRKKRGFISSETSQKYRKKVKPQKDDIFIVKSGSTTGKIAYVDFDEEFDIWSPLALVRVKKNINKKYIFYYLSSELFQQQIKDNWTFGTQPNIGMSTLINLKIKIPSKQKQDFLANNIELIINRIENIKYNITKQINNLQQLKQSLISDVVTGKVDVRDIKIPDYQKVNLTKDDINLDENFN